MIDLSKIVKVTLVKTIVLGGNWNDNFASNSTDSVNLNKSVKYISISGMSNGVTAITINGIAVPFQKGGVQEHVPFGCYVPSNFAGPGTRYYWSLPKKSLSEYGIAPASQYKVNITYGYDEYGCRSYSSFTVYFYFND